MAATSTSTSTSTPSPTPTPRRRYWEPMFYNCVVAVAGDLGDDGWRPEDVSRWVTHRGGNFLWQVKEKVTHVLATDEQFRSRKNAVIKKIQGYRKGVHVVTRDWLEDSINARRRLREDNYSLARREEEDKAEERRREATKKAAKKAAEQEVNFVNPNLNHIYRDSTYFPYQIKLTRNDEESGNVGEKYMLYLFESNSKPHLYIAAAKFWRKPHDRPSTWRSGETGKTFDATLALFKDFFYRKTGLRWDERVAKRGTTTKDKFQYEPPTGGKPVGLIKETPPAVFYGKGRTAATTPPSSTETKKRKRNGGEVTPNAEKGRKVNRTSNKNDVHDTKKDANQKPSRIKAPQTPRTSKLPTPPSSSPTETKKRKRDSGDSQDTDKDRKVHRTGNKNDVRDTKTPTETKKRNRDSGDSQDTDKDRKVHRTGTKHNVHDTKKAGNQKPAGNKAHRLPATPSSKSATPPPPAKERAGIKKPRVPLPSFKKNPKPGNNDERRSRPSSHKKQQVKNADARKTDGGYPCEKYGATGQAVPETSKNAVYNDESSEVSEEE